MAPLSESMVDREITGMVLAGGRSTRFGGSNKAIERLGNRTLLERVTDAVRTAFNRPPVVVVRLVHQRLQYERVVSGEVVFAFDDPRFRGPLAGIMGALNAVDGQWVFICGCDMPLLSPAVIQWLITNRPSTEIDAFVIEHRDGTLEPLHGLYRVDAIRDAQPEIATDAGVRSLLVSLPSVESVSITAFPDELPVMDSLRNVNTQDELSELERYLR